MPALVHEHVEATELVTRRAHHRLDSIRVGHVDAHGTRLATGGADLRDDGVSVILPRGRNDHRPRGTETGVPPHDRCHERPR